MGTLLEMEGENVFKVRAYFRAAENIGNLPEDIATIQRENRLSEIPGVGKALEEKIVEYLSTGRMSSYEKLIQRVPESLLDVINIPSVGPKKARLFFDELKVSSIEDLHQAALDGRLLELPGIKEKTVVNILKGIQVVQQGQERMGLGEAMRVADEIVTLLKAMPQVKRVEVAGSLRRMKETIRDIDILIDSTHPQDVMDAFVRLPQVKQVSVHGETKASIFTQDNIQVDLRVVEPKSFGAALVYFTGSKNFNVKLRQIAIRKKMKVNEYGVFRIKGKTKAGIPSSEGTLLAGKTEEECFKALGLPNIPPELREDIGEERLLGGRGPAERRVPTLVEQKDIKGDLHVHSTWSDGHNTISQLVEAARAKGYQYLGITDHSPRLKVAGGVSPQDLKKKKKEIERLNKGLKDFRILFGTEVEIDLDGNLDYNEKILSEFDIVIAAIHSGFEQSRERLTERLIKACRCSHVDIIAHPFGVHLGKREPCDMDFKEICKVAVDTNTFLEINAFPFRLDLNSANVYFAREHGVKFVVNTDAHSLAHFDFIKLGVAIARRGWATKKDILNTLPLKEFMEAIK